MKKLILIVGLFFLGITINAQSAKSFTQTICSSVQVLLPTSIVESEKVTVDGYSILLNTKYQSFTKISDSISQLVRKWDDVEVINAWYKDGDGIPTLILKITGTNYYIFFHYFDDYNEEGLRISIADLTIKLDSITQ